MMNTNFDQWLVPETVIASRKSFLQPSNRVLMNFVHDKINKLCYKSCHNARESERNRCSNSVLWMCGCVLRYLQQPCTMSRQGTQALSWFPPLLKQKRSDCEWLRQQKAFRFRRVFQNDLHRPRWQECTRMKVCGWDRLNRRRTLINVPTKENLHGQRQDTPNIAIHKSVPALHHLQIMKERSPASWSRKYSWHVFTRPARKIKIMR